MLFYVFYVKLGEDKADSHKRGCNCYNPYSINAYIHTSRNEFKLVFDVTQTRFSSERQNHHLQKRTDLDGGYVEKQFVFYGLIKVGAN